MAKRKFTHVVRVVIPDNPDNQIIPFLPSQVDGAFLDCLRYAGLIKVHDVADNRQCFDLICPDWIVKNGRSQVWAEGNAERMRSFGYNAVSVEVPIF